MKLRIKTPQLPNFIEVDVGDEGANVKISVGDLSNEDIDEMAISWRDAMKQHRDKKRVAPKEPTP